LFISVGIYRVRFDPRICALVTLRGWLAILHRIHLSDFLDQGFENFPRRLVHK
jgi:hypothetical protein